MLWRKTRRYRKSASYVSKRKFFDCNCLLTSQQGTDKAKVPRGVPNYFYKGRTRSSNLHNHLRKLHPEEYDQAVVDQKWKYKLSTDDTSIHKNPHNACNQDLPPFSSAMLLEHLVRFVVADDQVGCNNFVLFHTRSPLFSLFVLLSAPSFNSYVCSSMRPSSTLTSLVTIK
jgi:hypothetical protein